MMMIERALKLHRRALEDHGRKPGDAASRDRGPDRAAAGSGRL
jgi:hypothetical protein